jgi:hypothetical protein
MLVKIRRYNVCIGVAAYCVKLLGIDNPYRCTVQLDIVYCHTTARP